MFQLMSSTKPVSRQASVGDDASLLVFADEREAFLAWLETAGINGVLLLSGNVHFAELSSSAF